MDFVERLFGISPDGGDGSLEVLYLSVAVFLLAGIVFPRILGLIRRRF
jgi:hypothetical protein